MADSDAPPTADAPFAALDGHEFVVLTTYRRGGTPVPTTVWFALDGGRCAIQSGVNPAVILAPSMRSGEVLGEAMRARARVLPAGEAAVAEAALDRKYGERRRQIMAQMGRMERDYIEVASAG